MIIVSTISQTHVLIIQATLLNKLTTLTPLV